jgi:hypothetical protein
LKDIPFAKQLNLGLHGANWGKIKAGTYNGNYTKAQTLLGVAWDAYQDPGTGEIEEGVVILRHVTDVLNAVSIGLASEDEHRAIMLVGKRGSGKSRTLSLICAKHKATVIHALPSWSGSYLNFLNKFGEGFNLGPWRSGGDAESEILRSLSHTNPVICIDEFNHFSAAGINFLKAVLNQTRSVLVTATIPHFLAKMASDRSTSPESAQYLRRCIAIIHIAEPDERSVLQIQRALFPDLELAPGQASAIAAAAVKMNGLDSVCAILDGSDDSADVPASIERHKRSLRTALKPGEF